MTYPAGYLAWLEALDGRFNITAMHIWEAAQKAERKRIKDIICEVTGGFGNCDRLMEKIDDVS